MRIPHFQIIPEDIVIGNLQARDSGEFRFPLLYLQQIILTFKSYMAKLVQFPVYSFGYHSPLVDQQRRVVLYFAGYAVADGSA